MLVCGLLCSCLLLECNGAWQLKVSRRALQFEGNLLNTPLHVCGYQPGVVHKILCEIVGRGGSPAGWGGTAVVAGLHLTIDIAARTGTKTATGKEMSIDPSTRLVEIEASTEMSTTKDNAGGMRTTTTGESAGGLPGDAYCRLVYCLVLRCLPTARLYHPPLHLLQIDTSVVPSWVIVSIPLAMHKHTHTWTMTIVC